MKQKRHTAILDLITNNEIVTQEDLAARLTGIDSANPQLMILSRSVVTVNSAQNIVVIKTHAGMAQAAAAVLDALAFQEIIGSLAGDDTIFCVVGDNNAATQLTEKIKALL